MKAIADEVLSETERLLSLGTPSRTIVSRLKAQFGLVAAEAREAIVQAHMRWVRSGDIADHGDKYAAAALRLERDALEARGLAADKDASQSARVAALRAVAALEKLRAELEERAAEARRANGGLRVMAEIKTSRDVSMAFYADQEGSIFYGDSTMQPERLDPDTVSVVLDRSRDAMRVARDLWDWSDTDDKSGAQAATAALIRSLRESMPA